ncbi:MAG TPA: hypothetical protein VKR32_13450 [Puia sp.]|nr:hypothetical protein [Puia sp.]
MKISKLTTPLCLCLICFLACKKSSTSPNQQQSSGKTVRIQSSATHLLNLVFLVNYDQPGNITSVNDSIEGIVYTPTYDNAGNLVRILQTKGGLAADSALYMYNAQGQMTESVTSYLYTVEMIKFYYSAGILAADSTYAYDAGALTESSYETYQMTNGDITLFQQGIVAGVASDSTTFTYTSSPNPFKQLSLFNWTQGLENDNILVQYAFFNQHAIAGFSNSSPTIEAQSVTATYTYNSSNQVTGVQTTENEGSTNPMNFYWVISY